jgi:hypothetical protein
MGARTVRVDSSILLFVAASTLAAHIACGSSPATPGSPVPPTAAPTPPPTPTPDPGIPPAGSGCGEPYPPPLASINVKLHVKAPEYFTLDATPLVGPSSPYCREIGYTDGRQYCPVRLERDPERVPCEAWVMGNAEDTGKPGPTWMREWETYCTTFAESGCEHSPTNPMSLFIQTGGWYQACRGDGKGDDDICGEVEVDR